MSADARAAAENAPGPRRKVGVGQRELEARRDAGDVDPHAVANLTDELVREVVAEQEAETQYGTLNLTWSSEG